MPGRPGVEGAPIAPAGVRVQVRRYPGGQRSAYAAFEADARYAAEAGWIPTSQSYVPGTWGCGAWIIAFILLFFVIGIIVLAYMIVVRPDGELVVTYEHRGATIGGSPSVAGSAATSPVAASPAAAFDPAEALRKLGELRDAGLVTPEEFETKKAEILGRL